MIGLVVLLAFYIFYTQKSMIWNRSISVSGYAKSEVSNQIAKFSVSVTSLNDDKELAVAETKAKMDVILKSMKEMGIADTDIKTAQINVNQMEEMIAVDAGKISMPSEPVYPGRLQLGQWNAEVVVDVVLRDLTKTDAFTNAMNSSGATNLYGPNFQVDDDRKYADELIDEAIENAKVKAELMAKTTGSRLGKVLSISEDGYPGVSPMYDGNMMKSSELSMPTEVGTSTIYKSVMVTWSLK